MFCVLLTVFVIMGCLDAYAQVWLLITFRPRLISTLLHFLTQINPNSKWSQRKRFCELRDDKERAVCNLLRPYPADFSKVSWRGAQVTLPTATWCPSYQLFSVPQLLFNNLCIYSDMVCLSDDLLQLVIPKPHYCVAPKLSEGADSQKKNL